MKIPLKQGWNGQSGHTATAFRRQSRYDTFHFSLLSKELGKTAGKGFKYKIITQLSHKADSKFL